VVGTIASSASASTSIASVASVASVAIVLPATSQQILEESSKLWRSSGQGEPGKEESDRQLHVGEVSGEPVTLPYQILECLLAPAPPCPLVGPPLVPV